MRGAPARGQAAFVVLLAATTVWAAGGGSARAVSAQALRVSGPKQPSAAASARMVVTPNWSGYVAQAPVASTYAHPYFTSVTGTWTVPAARCDRHRGEGSSTVWVGLGVFHSHYRPEGNDPSPSLDQEEVGTDSNCAASGERVYYAWFELAPYPSVRTFPYARDKVSPGDTVRGLVKVLSPSLVELRLDDRTRGWTFLTKITFSSQNASTADWVVEAPAECVWYACHEASLANFGSVTMRNISAVGAGATGTLTDPDWKIARVRLVPGKLLVPTYVDGARPPASGARTGEAQSPAGATPGAPSRHGTRFKVKWVPVATRGL
jgi:hypothetical protein